MVANRPIISHVLSALGDIGVGEVAVLTPASVAGEICSCLEREAPAGVTLECLTYDPLEGRGELESWIGDAPAIVHRADGLLGEPLGPLVEVLLDESPQALLLVQSTGRESRRLALVPAPSSANGNTQPPLVTPGVVGVCLLGPGALGSLGPSSGASDLSDLALLAEQLMLAGAHTQTRPARRWRHFAGDLRDLLELNRVALEGLECESTPGSYDGNHFEGQMRIHPSATVKSSVIVGPVIIGAETAISDSYIGPHTAIGERVHIEGAELERSIVHADASVIHVGGRLVASVVGRRAKVFRDFSVPRALRLHVGDGDEVALC
ncbi:MAG TPA: NDP-sugar synthase [Solirubrobacteraceae bacterium]|nr:NDP-sugar synthase [Solirubrobacteraceae bacterium]